MTDETTDESNKEGEETNTDVTPVEEVTKNYEALKEANDKVEAELLRGEELKAKIALGGKSSAGEPELSSVEKLEADAKKEADGIVNAFR